MVAAFITFGLASIGFADYPLISHKFSADPTGLEYNGRLYLYCSNDTDNDTNGGYTMHSITCISSDDLKNWTDHGEVLQVPRDVAWASYSWAPSVITNNGLFYMYFGNNAAGIGVATSSVPTGPFKDARGSYLVNSSTPGAATGNQWYFDPCVFIDGGTNYLYFGGADPTNARVILLSNNLTSVSGSASPMTTSGSMTASNYFEASMMHKRNGIYYFSYSSRPSTGTKIQYATNSNPTSGFTFVGDAVPNPPHDFNNNNHHAFFTYQGVWYCAYHNRYLAEQQGIPTGYKRNVCLDLLNYNPDGTVQQVACTTNGLTQLKWLNPYNRVEAETMAGQSGIATEVCGEGGMDATNILNGNWIMVRGVDFTIAGATNFSARIASVSSGGNIELHLDGLAGTLIGTCAVPPTGGWQTWASVSAAVSNSTAKGVHDLYLKFTGASGTNLFNFNYWQFQSSTNNQLPISLVKFEAESGALGTNFAVINTNSPVYITTTSNSAGTCPTNSARVVTYTVTFPTPGTYQLFAHVRVGPGGGSDDSMFYGNGFGIKNPTNAADWILVNNINNVGFTQSGDVVTGGGAAGTGVWKWINFSLFAPGPTFAVTTTNLTQTFQIGAREDGLDMDAFVFGLSYYTYTVSNLDAGVDGTPPSAGVCSINWTNVLQRMDGFGGGAVFLDAGLDPVASTNMDTLFNTNNSNQFGLTLLRVRIAPNSNWSNSVSAWMDALTDAQRAVSRGGRVLATPWTPPAYMKTNNNTIGGALATNQYANYANYLNAFAGYMKSNGAQLAAVSVQNEPDFLATYESCIWNSNQFLSFFRTNAAAITNAPVMMPESFHFDQTLSDATLNDAVAVTNVSFVGGHLYGATIADYPNAHNHSKPTWMTEFLLNDQTIDSAIVTAQQIHDCLTTGNMSAYIWWKVIGNANGLINSNGVPQKRGFVMAQFSRFVRPGFNRIAVTNNGSVLVTAFRDTNSAAFAIVAINWTGIPLTPTFNLTNFPTVASVTPWMTSTGLSLAIQPNIAVSSAGFSYTLPGLSVVTFVGQTNSPPVLAAVGNQTINAGVTLNLTNTASDLDLPAQTLTFSLLNSPTNATLTVLNSTNALVTWRPFVSQAGTTNLFAVKVADNGSPSLSATNNFTVTVNPLSSQPSFSSILAAGNSFNLAIAGPTGPDYTLLTSTNLSDWQPLFTTNSPVTPFTLTVTNQNDPARFYQIQVGP
jgi:arabinoxylan arabinofuranohydrolase